MQYNSFGTCRACGSRIMWIKTKAGKNMPVNPEFVSYQVDPRGKERIVTEDGGVVAGKKSNLENADGYGYISHFATCSKK